jgi:hypothetical protein
MMQEMVRGYYDEYINDLESTEQNEKENGKEEEKEKNNNNNNRRSIIKTPPPPPPLILSIAKGLLVFIKPSSPLPANILLLGPVLVTSFFRKPPPLLSSHSHSIINPTQPNPTQPQKYN